MSKRAAEPVPFARAAASDAISDEVAARLLTARQRQTLISLSTIVTLPARGVIYHERAQAAAVFICREGAVKTFRTLPSGRKRVTAFLFTNDMFGLADRGRYVNTAQALTKTALYRLPIEPLKVVLRSDAELEFKFLMKMTHELRKLQLQTIMLGRRSAAGRIAMFLMMLQRHVQQGPADSVPLPMSRSDVAGYLGLSLEAVSRATRQLVDDGLIAFRGAHDVRVVDPKGLEQLAEDY